MIHSFIHHCEYTNLKVTAPTIRKVPCLGKGVLSFFRNVFKSQWNSNVHIVHTEIQISDAFIMEPNSIISNWSYLF